MEEEVPRESEGVHMDYDTWAAAHKYGEMKVEDDSRSDV